MCQQDYVESTALIFTETGGGMEHGPGKNPLNFEADPDHLL